MAPPVWSEHRKSPGRRLLRLRFTIARVALHIFLPNRAALVRRGALHPAIDKVRAGRGGRAERGGFMGGVGALIVVVVVAVVVIAVLASIKSIGPTEVGLVTKRLGFGKLGEENAIAFHGEAGYQAKLLKPGLRFKLWPVYGVKKFPWVQVPAGEIGVVIAQVGEQLPIGAKSG